MYYCKDHEFFQYVIQNEEAPFEFKIYLFPQDQNQFEKEPMKEELDAILTKYNAEKVDFRWKEA